MLRLAAVGVALGALISATPVHAQGSVTTRLLMLDAEDRRTPTTADLGLLRSNARSRNPDAARVAVRAMGRLQRPGLIPDILPALRHAFPEVRVEAAAAVAQAAQGPQPTLKAAAGTAAGVLSAQAALLARLNLDDDPAVRGALCEALARLPYKSAGDVLRAETAIVDLGTHTTLVADRLGVAKALENFVRVQAPVKPLGAETIALLQQLARTGYAVQGVELRDARVRRLALEALIVAGRIDSATIERAARDTDAQVRRLALRAVGVTGAALDSALASLLDVSPLVRSEALLALTARGGDAVCAPAIRAAADVDMNTALVALDALARCASSPDAVALLVRTVGDVADISTPRGWHRQAHALVALATTSPGEARAALPAYASAGIWQVRRAAVQAAAALNESSLLEAPARDPDDRVANLALAALGRPLRPARLAARLASSPVTAAEIRRLSSPRARITIRDVGTVDIALLTSEAPGSVIRFARLAEAGRYRGRSFDRLVVNDVAQTGSDGDSEAARAAETGNWPHVRGSVAISSTDADDQRFFINLVDNPRFDHRYAVIGQVLSGHDVVDRLLEGDVIESIVIVP